MSDYNELGQFDQAFTPSTGRRPGLDTLADGEYDFEILGAELARTPTTNELLLKMNLKVLSTGGNVEKVYFFRTQQNVDILGSDLTTLGTDADKWKAPARPFSKELPAALPKLVGKKFRGNKVTAPNPQDTSKPYHNLYINNLLGTGHTPAGPAPKPVPKKPETFVPETNGVDVGGEQIPW